MPTDSRRELIPEEMRRILEASLITSYLAAVDAAHHVESLRSRIAERSIEECAEFILQALDALGFDTETLADTGS